MISSKETGDRRVSKGRIDKNTCLYIVEVTWPVEEYSEIRSRIERCINNKWSEIGHIVVQLETSKIAKILDCLIGTRNGLFVSYDEEESSWPENIQQAVRFRRKGIGSKALKLVLARLKKRGIKLVYGELSDADDKAKASNFWRKNNFEINSDKISKKL